MSESAALDVVIDLIRDSLSLSGRAGEPISSDTLRTGAGAGGYVGKGVVPANHPIFADHFPGVPLLPGSVLLELAAQVAGPLCEEVTAVRFGFERGAVLGIVRRAVFLRPCFL